MIMNGNVRKLSAIMLITAMSVASATAAFEKKIMADAGRNNKNTRDDVQKVILPTDVDEIFDFILDPQQLINETNGAAYDGQTFEKDTTLFFKRSDGESKEDYNSTSDAMKIVNKGETEVEVVLTAKVVSLGGIRMTDDRKFSDDTGASLYLALTGGDETVPIDGDRGAEIHAKISPAGDEDDTYSFRLTGAANRNGDWGGVTDANPKVIVTWKIIPLEPEEEALEESGVSAESKADHRDSGKIWTAVSPTEPES